MKAGKIAELRTHEDDESTVPLLCLGSFVLLFWVGNVPGIDFETVRSQVSMTQVLELLEFVVHERSGRQVRGGCPVHRSRSVGSRSFSANLDENVYQCFKCGSSGGTLELWAAVHNISVYAAAIDLCDRLGIDVPWVHKW